MVRISDIPAVADDLTLFNAEHHLLSTLSGSTGWGQSIKFNKIEISTPSCDVEITQESTDYMTEEEKVQLLRILSSAQQRKLQARIEKLKKEYGIEIDEQYREE